MAEDEEYFEDAELDFDEPEGDDDYDFGDQGGWVDDDPETITLEYDDGTNDIVPIEDDAEFDAVAAEYQLLME